jgi:D-alanyl-D-alanine carboxypeptidase/D-alanyl-D-alanine-endopeptidase (penicillin-binding protein 4)
MQTNRLTILTVTSLMVASLTVASSPLAIADTSDGTELEHRIAEILDRPIFRGSSFGVFVTETATGKVVYQHRPDALLAPASTTKLVSCAGALCVLGKDFRFETPVVRTGPIVEGQVRGDLVLVASGDPNLSQRAVPEQGAFPEEGKGRQPSDQLRYVDRDHTYAGFTQAETVSGDPLVVLRDLARQIVDAGVKEVTGDMIVDDGLFKDTQDSFVGEFSAVCVNDNVIDVSIAPGSRVGDSVFVTWRPMLPSIRIDVEARTTAADGMADLWIERRPGVASFVVRGVLPVGSKPTLRVGRLSRPALAVSHFLRDLLSQKGVRVHGQARQARFGPAIYRPFAVIAKHVSPPFSESVKVTLKVSHNLHATMYPVLVGALKGSRGDRATGYGRLYEFFKRQKLDVDSVILQSGSGGGRADTLSARFTVGLLDLMAKRDDFPVFLDALPIGGKDGTLAPHFRSSPLRGKVRAKTGTLVYKGSFNQRWIYLAKSLAGYIDFRTEERPQDFLSFSILIANTITAERKRGVEELFRAQEDILETVGEEWLRSRAQSERRADDAD